MNLSESPYTAHKHFRHPRKWQVQEAASLRRLAAWKPAAVPYLLKKALHAKGLYSSLG